MKHATQRFTARQLALRDAKLSSASIISPFLISVASTYNQPTSPGSPPFGAERTRQLTSPEAEAREFDAAIFDMDGVITQTVAVHALAWKRMFDEYLRSWAANHHAQFCEFTPQDYLAYVDGRPRYQGVEALLKARGITLPFGSPSDQPGTATICGLGNAKNAEFNRIIASAGVAVYDSTVALIQALLVRGVRIGLATSSRNSAVVLAKTGIAGLFGTVVDGTVSEQLGLTGKPAPDIFVTAARNLAVANTRAIVVEDAVAGVQAGARGGFGLVIGVARENNVDELRASGADLVVQDLAETNVEEIGRLVRAKRART